MSALQHLKEELREVFQIYDEDGSGNLSFAELMKALHTVTGTPLPRSEVVQLYKTAKKELSLKARQSTMTTTTTTTNNNNTVTEGGEEEGELSTENHNNNNNNNGSSSQPAHLNTPTTVLEVSARSESANPFDSHRTSTLTHHQGPNTTTSSTYNNNNSISSGGGGGAHHNTIDLTDGIDFELFEMIVHLKTLQRSYEEECQYGFALLQDSSYEGFITRESLARAAKAVEEPLTETEIGEMFHSLVTGVPTAAVDFQTFLKIQEAARGQQEGD